MFIVRELQTGRLRVRFPRLSVEFSIHIILSATVWPGVDTASNKSEHQEYFLGKAGWVSTLKAAGLTTLPSSYADCPEIWKPRPPGTFRAYPNLFRNCFTFTFTFTFTCQCSCRSLLAYGAVYSERLIPVFRRNVGISGMHSFCTDLSTNT